MLSAKKVAVVGGGISGLLAAHEVLKRGMRVSVFEAGPRAGGWIRSERRDGVLLEWGPNTLMANQDWFDLFADLTLRPQYPRRESKRRFIAVKDGILELPSGPISFFLSSFLSTSSKLKLLCDPFRSLKLQDEDLSIHEFAIRYLNQEILDQVLQPFVSGVYAGDAKKLSLKACFPKLWRGLNLKGSIIRGMISQRDKTQRVRMVSFPGGLEEIVGALTHRLGARLQLHTRVLGLECLKSGQWNLKSNYGDEVFDHIVLAAPATEVANLCEGMLSPAHLGFLKSIHYQRIMVWNLICERGDFQRGFGCLFPRTLGSPILGSLWRSEIFEGAAPENRVALSQFFAGDHVPSDPETYELEIRKIQPKLGAKIYSEWRTYERGIPQLEVGHCKKMSAVLEALPPGLSLTGNYIEGVGLLAIIQNVKRTIAQISL